MRFSWKGRTFDVAMDINRGIRPKFIDDEEKEEYNYLVAQIEGTVCIEFKEGTVYNEHGYRHLQQDERMELYDHVMKNQGCNFCGQKVYCAEYMCLCPQTFLINAQQTWQNKEQNCY